MNEGPAIEAEGLVKYYGKTQALSGLDLTVPVGTVYGLLGPNGAGKTTAVRVLATLLKPDAGRARVLGQDVLAQAAAVRRTIGLTGQYAALDEYLTGRSNLIMIGQLSRLTARAARRRADELLERFGLTDAAGRAVKTYSGGMRRRLDLAASLIGHPAVLFLDEPTTGLDPSGRALMWVIVRELVADGTTLLLTTQYLDEADQLASRIAVIDGGRVIAEGTPADLKSSVGGQRIMLTLADAADRPAAARALAPFTARLNGGDPEGSLRGGMGGAQPPMPGGLRPGDMGAGALMPEKPVPPGQQSLMEVPVTAADGLATEVLRALDAAGVAVSDISVRSASLDDVFLTLTARAAEIQEEAEPAAEEVAV